MKAEINNLIDISSKLPERFDMSFQKTKITGRDIHLSGLDSNGVDFNDNEYIISMPMYQLVNHKRRLLRAFKSNGIIGARSYINKVINLD